MDSKLNPAGQPWIEEPRATNLRESFYEMACVMRALRRHCPWDQKQTPESLRRYLLEETYEVLETIDRADWNALRDELGDFMLQAFFQAEIQSEQGRFGIEDVLRSLIEKMVRRHPHVFADADASDSEAVRANWEAIKRAEKGQPTQSRSLLDGVPPALPALMASFKTSVKAARAGFEWDTAEQVLDKVMEEIEEVRAELHGDPSKLQEELGDLLFSVSNLCRKCGCEPEETLREATAKFTRRFKAMEALAGAEGLAFETLSLEQQEALWLAVKASK